MRKDTIGIRMKKNYEVRQKISLIRRVPVILRLDGNSFSKLTKKRCVKPFDEKFNTAMVDTALFLCKKVIQGAKCAYIQSDEISILITDFDTLKTEAWFDYELSKIESISSSKASVYFTWAFKLFEESCFNGCFDSRARNYPREEVKNYFVWRQLDWFRNSIIMYTRSLFSHKQMMNKNQSDMHEMIHSKGYNWSELESKWKNGVFIYKVDKDWIKDDSIIFTQQEGKIINNYVEDK